MNNKVILYLCLFLLCCDQVTDSLMLSFSSRTALNKQHLPAYHNGEQSRMLALYRNHFHYASAPIILWGCRPAVGTLFGDWYLFWFYLSTSLWQWSWRPWIIHDWLFVAGPLWTLRWDATIGCVCMANLVRRQTRIFRPHQEAFCWHQGLEFLTSPHPSRLDQHRSLSVLQKFCWAETRISIDSFRRVVNKIYILSLYVVSLVV